MNSSSQKKILERYDGIIALGENVRGTRRSPPAGVFSDDFVDTTLANQWFVTSLNLISRTIGETSEHYTALKRLYIDYPKWKTVNQAFGVVLAAKEDIKSDALFDTKALITAEVFDDILEQGKALLESGYFAPAAVVIGCVLEDSLRRLCDMANVAITDKTKLDKMNSDLAKAGVYNLLTQKKITALADIRNNAAHGKWNKFDENEVTEMLRWTQDFIERHFS